MGWTAGSMRLSVKEALFWFMRKYGDDPFVSYLSAIFWSLAYDNL